MTPRVVLEHATGVMHDAPFIIGQGPIFTAVESVMTSKLPGLPDQHRLIVLDEVDSTNSEALRRGASGDCGPLWIMARQQQKGRGRSGRNWDSMPGNLYASLLLGLSCGPEIAQQLALLAGVALHDTVLQLASVRPIASDAGLLHTHERRGHSLDGLRLKWPNDLLIGTSKCAGILCESVAPSKAQQSGISLLGVTGIGMNLNCAPKDAGRLVTCLHDHGINADAMTALASLANRFAHWRQVWQEGLGFSSIRSAWLERAGPLGEAISINLGDGAGREALNGAANSAGLLHGDYAGLDEDGALLMKVADEGLRRFTFGDVTLQGK